MNDNYKIEWKDYIRILYQMIEDSKFKSNEDKRDYQDYLKNRYLDIFLNSFSNFEGNLAIPDAKDFEDSKKNISSFTRGYVNNAVSNLFFFSPLRLSNCYGFDILSFNEGSEKGRNYSENLLKQLSNTTKTLFKNYIVNNYQIYNGKRFDLFLNSRDVDEGVKEVFEKTLLGKLYAKTENKLIPEKVSLSNARDDFKEKMKDFIKKRLIDAYDKFGKSLVNYKKSLK